ncbi:MAG: hypothetical protein K6E17_06455 [Clostridiales bacterium]|nr:hypothetical protein [Clostridiales bacterium]
MRGNKRIPALILGIGMLLVLLSSFAFIALEADHDCRGEDCEICEVLSRIEALLQHMAVYSPLLAVSAVCAAALRFFRLRGGARVRRAVTLVFWKVRLNN